MSVIRVQIGREEHDSTPQNGRKPSFAVSLSFKHRPKKRLPNNTWGQTIAGMLLLVMPHFDFTPQLLSYFSWPLALGNALLELWVWVKITPPRKTAGFSPCTHLPAFHFGYPFLTHSPPAQTETKSSRARSSSSTPPNPHPRRDQLQLGHGTSRARLLPNPPTQTAEPRKGALSPWIRRATCSDSGVEIAQVDLFTTEPNNMFLPPKAMKLNGHTEAKPSPSRRDESSTKNGMTFCQEPRPRHQPPARTKTKRSAFADPFLWSKNRVMPSLRFKHTRTQKQTHAHTHRHTHTHTHTDTHTHTHTHTHPPTHPPTHPRTPARPPARPPACPPARPRTHAHANAHANAHAHAHPHTHTHTKHSRYD